MIISYTTLFQPTYFYETSYKYETTDSKYQHDVNITVSIKGQTFSSIIIVREVGVNENKNYYKVKGSGNILKKIHINIILYLIILMCIQAQVKPI